MSLSNARRGAWMALAAAASIVSGCGSSGASESDGAPGTVAFLYALDASGGTLRASGGPESFTLTLRNVGPRVTVFSDRPQRITFSEGTEAFVRLWARRFASDPPNAALDLLVRGKGTGAREEPAAVVLELTKPQLNGRTLTFSARRLRSPGAGLSHYADRATGDPPRRFGAASLFIDDEDEVPVRCRVFSPAQQQYVEIVVAGDYCTAIGGTVLGYAT